MEEEGRKSKGDMWWFNENMNEAVSGKKYAHKTMYWDSIEENKRKYESMKNKARKAV